MRARLATYFQIFDQGVLPATSTVAEETESNSSEQQIITILSYANRTGELSKNMK